MERELCKKKSVSLTSVARTIVILIVKCSKTLGNRFSKNLCCHPQVCILWSSVFLCLKITTSCKRKVSEASVLIPGTTRFPIRSPLLFVSTCKFTSTLRVKLNYK